MSLRGRFTSRQGEFEIIPGSAPYRVELLQQRLCDIPFTQIFLDNESQAGLTPFTLERLPAGEHQIRLEKDGYLPMETVVTVIASEITVLEVELTADGEAAPPAPFWKKRWARITGGVLGAGLIYVLMSGGGDDVPEETGNPPEELPDFPGPPN